MLAHWAKLVTTKCKIAYLREAVNQRAQGTTAEWLGRLRTQRLTQEKALRFTAAYTPVVYMLEAKRGDAWHLS